jgi:hypothetical protein
MISGLTVRCFRNDHRPDDRYQARVARPVSAATSGPDEWPAASHTPATKPTRVVLAAATTDMALVWRVADMGPQPLLPQATAASKRGEHGRCPVSMATPTAHAGTEVDCRRYRRTPPLWPSAVPSRFRTPADGVPRPVSARRLRWLEEPLAGSAAAGGMQPAPMDANEPGGQAAAELAADIGHRRPGE